MSNNKGILTGLLVLVLWQFFHFSIDALRFDPRFFWPAIVIILILLSANQKERLSVNKYVIWVTFVFIYILFSSFNSIYPSASFYSLVLLTLYFLTAYLISRKQSKLQFLKILFVLTVFHLVYIAFQLLLPSIFYSMFDIFNSTTSADAYNNAINNAYRGFTGQTSISAFYYATGLIVSLSLLKLNGSKKKIFYFFVVAFFFSIIMTNRRGTFSVAIILLLLFFLLSIKARSKMVLLVILVPIIIAIGVENLPGVQAILDKFNIYLSSDNITSGRIELWQNAIIVFRNNILWGTGWLSYNSLFDVTSAHNSYLQLLSDLGLVGSVIFFTPFILGFIYTAKKFIKIKHNNDHVSAFFTFSFYFQIFFFLSSMFEGYFQEEILVFILFLVQMLTFQVAIRKHNNAKYNN